MNWLREELETIDPVEPDTELQEGDVIVGTLESVMIKKIFALRLRTRKEMQERHEKMLLSIAEASNCEPGSAEHYQCGIESQLFKMAVSKQETLDWLFWTCLWNELTDEALAVGRRTRKWCLGVRKDWQIVFTKDGSLLEVIIRSLTNK